MRIALLLLTLTFSFLLSAQTQNGTWTWKGGDSIHHHFDRHGTQGIPDASNFPSARAGAVRWTDAGGNVWMYGGSGFADLWRFDSNTEEWTWIRGDNVVHKEANYGSMGSPGPNNQPGARSSSTGFTDLDGNLWMFGGYYHPPFGGGMMNDLWKYDISTNRWTWVKGSGWSRTPVYGTKGVPSPSNDPGSLAELHTWVDQSGNFWFFGGLSEKNASGTSVFQPTNTLWKFEPATGNWTWMAGGNDVRQGATYGTKGIASTSNTPGARKNGATWSDASGNLWLYGGQGIIVTGSSEGLLNDLWKYDPIGNTWTWVSGDNSFTTTSDYGTKGISASTNTPGARFKAANFIDASGNFWLFGGTGYVSGTSGDLNDLWKYNPVINQWTWVAGNSLINEPGIYGVQGVAAVGNHPGGRAAASAWINPSGEIQITSGIAFDVTNKKGVMNDLWKYNPITEVWTWVKGYKTIFKPAYYGTKNVTSPENLPGKRVGAITAKDASGNLWMYGGSGFDGNGNSGYLSDLWKFESSSMSWTWIAGDSTAGSMGNFSIKGTPNASVNPGARMDGNAWIDATGNFWLFGGDNNAAYYNDLWKYNPVTNMWTWLTGSSSTWAISIFGAKGVESASNVIGARVGAANWIDATNNLWVFGGLNGGMSNELWRYNPVTNRWTWMHGDQTMSPPGEFGIQGIASSTNKPPGTGYSTSWKDASGNFWLFGGVSPGSSNSLWKYNSSTNEWTWMSGDQVDPKFAQYGTKGIAASSNKPGTKSYSVSWVDGAGNFWISGGSGNSTSLQGNGVLNDLWKYNVSSNLWTWITGDSVLHEPGTYGTRNISSIANTPGARIRSVSWTDASGNLWLFSGQGYDQTGEFDLLNDLWMFSSAGTLPVVYRNFTATLVQNIVELKWQTSLETGNKHFIIERSHNGVQFENIGKIPGHRANSNYSFSDVNPKSGKNYYRLRQVDLNGDERFSQTRLIQVEPTAKINWFLRADHHIEVRLLSGNNEFYHVTDMNGRTINKGHLVNGVVVLPKWSRGVYVVEILSVGKKYTAKIVQD